MTSKNFIRISVISRASAALSLYCVNRLIEKLSSGNAEVDFKLTLQSILKLSRHEQRALEDRAILPAELNLPRPTGYTNRRHVELCASFSASIRSDRQFKWSRGIAISGAVLGVLGVVLGVVLGAILKNGG